MKFKEALKTNFSMIGYVVRYTPGYFFLMIFNRILQAVLGSIAPVYFVKYVFDRLETGGPYTDILNAVFIMAALTVAIVLFDNLFYWMYESWIVGRLHEKMQRKLFEKARTLDLSCYDDPEFYNDFVWASGEANDRALNITKTWMNFFQHLISGIGVFALLLSMDVMVIVVLVCAMVISTLVNRTWMKIGYEQQQESQPISRKTWYASRVFYMSEYAKEMRLSGLDELMKRHFDEAVDANLAVTRKYAPRNFLLGLIVSVSNNFLLNAGVTMIMAYRLFVSHTITLGDFSASLTAAWALYNAIFSISHHFLTIKKQGLYAEKFHAFLAFEPKVRDRENAKEMDVLFEELSLKNVSFSYPNNDKFGLQDINLTIRRGERVAFVGYNGAGKSTLIKLLLRLYEADGGSIYMNGEDIRNYTVESYRRKFGAAFQDYRLFAATIAENVLGDSYDPEREQLVLDALKISEFTDKLAELPKGIHTEYGREYTDEGVLLSGGESQKLAIARVFARQGDLVVLDEPSSALDPIAEYQVNQAMMAAAGNKTILFISHRLSTTRMADRIYMLDSGRIIEEGSHDELMALDGRYAEMFRIQAEKYQESGVCE